MARGTLGVGGRGEGGPVRISISPARLAQSQVVPGSEVRACVRPYGARPGSSSRNKGQDESERAKDRTSYWQSEARTQGTRSQVLRCLGTTIAGQKAGERCCVSGGALLPRHASQSSHAARHDFQETQGQPTTGYSGKSSPKGKGREACQACQLPQTMRAPAMPDTAA